MAKITEYNEGIMIFKDTFEYLINGDLTETEFCELINLIYNAKWCKEIAESDISNKNVRIVWKTLKHSIRKSVANSKQYARSKTKQQDLSTTELKCNAPIFSMSFNEGYDIPMDEIDCVKQQNNNIMELSDEVKFVEQMNTTTNDNDSMDLANVFKDSVSRNDSIRLDMLETKENPREANKTDFAEALLKNVSMKVEDTFQNKVYKALKAKSMTQCYDAALKMIYDNPTMKDFKMAHIKDVFNFLKIDYTIEELDNLVESELEKMRNNEEYALSKNYALVDKY